MSRGTVCVLVCALLTEFTFSTIFIKDTSTLPPAKGGKRAPAKSSLSHLKAHRVGLFDNKATIRSVPASPSLGATRSPLQNATSLTSGALSSQKSQKAEALKIALLHLLAIRPVSQKFLAASVKCTTDECAEILQKYGKQARLDHEKYDLSDRGYKELDIWSFPYKHQDDRQAAIDRAVSAFDRQRLSREEKLWQLLLPKSERNKGTILSKLHLHNGPIQRVSTPRINVEHTDDTGNGGSATGSDDEKRQGRLAPSDAEPGARASSLDIHKKKKVSEKEAQSKRLLSKNPKKATLATQAKEKKSELAKSKESKPEVIKSKDSKLATKKEVKNEPSTSTLKVKSEEYVHDSDEDVEMEDSIVIAAAPAKSKPVTDGKATPSNSIKKQVTPSITSAKPKAQSVLESKKPTLTPVVAPENTTGVLASSSSGSGQKSVNGQKAAPMRRTLSHQRNTSSPIKPSPLGSSPPTNASDLEHGDQSRRGTSSLSSANVSPQKDINIPTNKGVAQRVNRPAQNTSEHSLKRKAGDLDSDIHVHSKLPLVNGNDHSAKRRQTSTISPPTSDSSSSISPKLSSHTIDLARRFKEYWTRYEKAHRELSALPNPPQERIEQVLKMHERLEGMKAEITKQIVS